MKKKVLITYSQSPLTKIWPFFYDNFEIIDEKFTDFGSLDGDEIWLDAYIDLFDERLNNYDYLYQFFARFHKICDNIKITKKRILRNFSYTTSFSQFYKVFYLYYSFVNFFEKTYEIRSIYIPDVLDIAYKNHPYNQILMNQSIPWNKKSLFRVIHINDIVNNLLNDQLEDRTVIIQGMKVSLCDISNKIIQVFGVKDVYFENAYDICVEDDLSGQVLTEVNYNLEALCIAHLQSTNYN